jgi:uncharacterized SAM-binding protein YcdF (DUF218 family)
VLVGAGGLLLSAAALAYAGRFLAHADPLQTADAIFVLAGTRVERPLEAADLFREGYAPRIVLTRGASEQQAIRTAEGRGAIVPGDADLTVALLRSLGVPSEAVLVAPALHDSTADEARTLRTLAGSEGWTRVIVVSSTYHLRRAAIAMRRAVRGTGVEVIMRASRHDPSTPDRWWQRRADIRWIVSETPKLIAYAVGASG